MTGTPSPTTTPRSHRDWVRAAALLGVALAMSVVHPVVLIAAALLPLLALRGTWGLTALLLAAMASVTLAMGPHDGVWYVERAWAVIASGTFLALTVAVPAWKLSTRAMAATFVTAAVAASVVATRPGGWGALDWMISSGITSSVATTLDAMTVLRSGEPIAPAFVGAMYEMAEAQVTVFPALVGLATMAALALASWVAVRATGGDDRTIGPMSGFRFNDHMVWLMIGGLVLVVTRFGGAMTRLGANAVVFMGALYALRGAGVVMFVTGGFSFFGYALLLLCIFGAAPVVLGAAILIGIGDTWLDLRARAGEAT